MGYLFEYESFLSLKPYVAHLVWRITELLKLQKSGQFPYEPVRIKV